MTFTLAKLPPRARKAARSLETAGILAEARAAKADVDAAEARKLRAAVEWARLHEVDDPDLAETWGDTPITLAGEGAPLIGTGCVGEFAAVIGTTTNGGRAYIADALELAHRLPTVYARIQAGTLPAWKGRRIARDTIVLPPGAAELDTQIAPLAAKLSARATEQMVAKAIQRALPEYSQQLSDADTTQRVVVDHRQVSFYGTSKIFGALDLADALDLEDALNREAAALAAAGCEATLDARRAMALGRLARGETADQTTGQGRPVTLYVHLPADPDGTALLENGSGPHLLSTEQIATWLRQPNTQITVKPVIDLNQPLSTTAYQVPDRIKEHVDLRDRVCAFPGCEHLARSCQKDHIAAYDDGGPTDTDNLAPLCQHHHNLKTHAGWSYTPIERGVYLWRSPHGYQFLRDRHGTEDITPDAVDPPGS